LAAHVSRTYGYLSVYVVGDAVSAAFGGATTGCGRQRFAACVVIGSYGAVALPLGYFLAFRVGRGYLGIVAAMTLGTCLQCAGNAAITWTTDFPAEAAAAVERVRKHGTTSNGEKQVASGGPGLGLGNEGDGCFEIAEI